MARKPHTDASQQELFDESIRPGGGIRVFKTAADFASAAPKKKQYKRRDFSSIANRYITEVEQMVERAMASDDPSQVWAVARAEHMVGLYAVMHRTVYKVLPGELAGDWMAACSAVNKLLKDEFDGSYLQLVEYLQWAFAQEKRQEVKRKEASTWRLGWRWAFMKRELLTTFRVSRQRKSRPG